MQQFDITVATVGAFTVHAAGRYIKYVAGSNGGGDASLIVTPGAQGGNKITLKPGQAYRVADKSPTPDSWTLQSGTGSATIIGTVVVGDGRIDDTTIAGTVNVVDAGLTRTQINSAFIGQGFKAADAANRSNVQLFNPAGSGKLIVIEAVTAISTTGNYLANFYLMNAVIPSGTDITAGSNSSKLAGGALGVAKVYAAASATSIPGLGGTVAGLGGNASMSTYQVFKEPIILPPGYGMNAGTNAINVALQAGWEWFEVSQ
jgi:hypothetical protein